ncbi:unnamed protein product [Auanema sp. JU1783]|nr:unnamed protein product [Auanema sp. JU1783]
MLFQLWLFPALIAAALGHSIPLGEAISQECLECRVTVDLYEKEYGDKTTDHIGELLIDLCISFKVETNYICRAGLSNYKEEIEYVLDTTLTTPKQICSLVLDNCGKFFDPMNVTWQLPMPGSKPPVIPKTPGQHTLKVLHLTDIHIDRDYVVGSEAQCSNKAFCCRPDDDPNELNKEGVDIVEPAGYWGTRGKCDVPFWFVDNMLQQIAETHKDVDYIYLTGDLESHAVWDYTKEAHADRIRNISALIRSHFPDKKVYFAVGNHEGVPMDSFAPHFTPAKFNMSWLYDTIADSWKDSIPSDQVNLVKYNGCFMVKPFPGLRIISLNNGYGDTMNFFLMVNQTDPDNSMSWFIKQLDDAEKAGDKVHVIAHIPGGTPEGMEGFSLNYYRAMIRYENTVAGQFFGHVHAELFYMFYENPNSAQSRPVDVVYSAPSVTTYSRYNPAYRIYTIDGNYIGSTFRVIDWEEYVFDMKENNKNPQKPTWQTLYSSVLQEYGLKGNLPSEWSNLINRMKTDDALFNKFMKNYYRSTEFPDWDEDSRLERLCSLRKSHHSEELCSDLKKAGSA